MHSREDRRITIYKERRSEKEEEILLQLRAIDEVLSEYRTRGFAEEEHILAQLHAVNNGTNFLENLPKNNFKRNANILLCLLTMALFIRFIERFSHNSDSLEGVIDVTAFVGIIVSYFLRINPLNCCLCPVSQGAEIVPDNLIERRLLATDEEYRTILSLSSSQEKSLREFADAAEIDIKIPVCYGVLEIFKRHRNIPLLYDILESFKNKQREILCSRPYLSTINGPYATYKRLETEKARLETALIGEKRRWQEPIITWMTVERHADPSSSLKQSFFNQPNCERKLIEQVASFLPPSQR